MHAAQQRGNQEHLVLSAVFHDTLRKAKPRAGDRALVQSQALVCSWLYPQGAKVTNMNQEIHIHVQNKNKT